MTRRAMGFRINGLSRLEARTLQRQIDRRVARRQARRTRPANDNIQQPAADPAPATVRLMEGDCLARLRDLPDRSVDLIAADLPYGSTACAWDAVIPFDEMWAEFERVLKPRGAVVLTASGMFTAALCMSRPEWLKYRLVWKKTRKTGFQHAWLKPLSEHEDICVFSPGTTIHAHRSNRQMTYHPQGVVELAEPNLKRVNGTVHASEVYGLKTYKGKAQTHTGFPTSVLEFASVGGRGRHPTEKPVDLMAWIIRSYSNPGDVVLDPTMGSGTTGVAAVQEGRRFVGIEKDARWFARAVERIGAGEDATVEELAAAA